MLPSHRIAVVADTPYFAECGNEFCKAFSDSGHSAELRQEIPSDAGWDVILVIGIHLFPNVTLKFKTLVVGGSCGGVMGILRRLLRRIHQCLGRRG